MTRATHEPADLDPQDWEELRALGHRMVDDSIAYLAGVRERRPWTPVPAETKRRLALPLPRRGQGDAATYAEFQRDVLPYPVGNIHPRFWGWVMGSGVPSAVFAEFLAATMNANAGGFDQASTEVELAVIGWMKAMLGMPAAASGLLTSGASAANLIGLTVAREHHGGERIRADGLTGRPGPLLVYASSEVHSSMVKSLELLGLGTRGLVTLPARADYTLDPVALGERIRADRAAGAQPVAIVASAGTVNTGAIDPLDALADLAARERVWLHVDGAIGAPACLDADLRTRFKGIERADSIGFDLHKWLYMPYECGCVVVRDRALHAAPFAVTASYLAALDGGVARGIAGFGDLGPQLSRGFNALKVWFALKSHGAEAFAAAIRRNVAQAQLLTQLVEADPELELLAPTTLNIVNFRYVPRGRDAATLDALNQRILIRLQEDGIAVPSSTVLGGRFALRVAITNHRSRDADFELLVREAKRLGAELG